MGGKRLAINMIANVVAFVVQFGINFLLTPYIVRTLGSEAYGFVQLSNNVISWVGILTVALNSMSGRFICIEINRQNTKKAKEYFNSVLMANTVLACVLMIPGILFVLFADKVMNVPAHLLSDVQFTFAFAFVGMEVQLLLNVFATVYYTTNRVDIQAKRNIEGSILRAIILVALFASLPARMWYVTGTMMVVYVYLGLADVYYTRKLTPQLKVDIHHFKGAAVKELLSSGVWNSVNQLSLVLLTSLDIYLMNVLIGATAAGEYSVAKTLPNFIQSFVGTMVSVFVPQFTILYAQKKKGDLLRSINFSVKVMGYVMALPIGFLIVFAPNFFQLWVPGQDIATLQGMSLLTIIPMIVTGSINTIYNVYTVTNKLKVPALVWVAFGVLQVVTVIVLALFTPLGVWSVPLSSFVWGLFRNLTFTPVYAAHCLDVHWSTFYKAIVRGALCTAVMALVAAVFHRLVIVDSWLLLICMAVLCSFIAGAINLFVVFSRDERLEFKGILVGKFLKTSN